MSSLSYKNDGVNAGPFNIMNRILEPNGISIVFQPIFEIIGGLKKIHAFECLARGPVGTNMERTNILFEYARRKGIEIQIDRKCIFTAMRESRNIKTKVPININVHASMLSKSDKIISGIIEPARNFGISLSDITLEIVEYSPPLVGVEFQKNLNRIRDMGIRIALDDIGKAHSNYVMILEVKPDYFKVDQYFVSGCHADLGRQAVIESILCLARRLGGRVIAEGIQDRDDFDSLTSMGVDLFQGHLFATPMTVVGIEEFMKAENAIAI